MSHGDAVDEDACQPDSLARCTKDGPGSATTHAEWDPLFTIAEWNDVHLAKGRVIARGRQAEHELGLQLQLAGYSAREVGELLKQSHVTIWRHSAGLLGLILDELGGEALPPAPAVSQLETCLHCATRPRVMLRARFRWIRGRGKVQTRPERQAAVCAECLVPSRRDEIVTARAWRAAA